MKIDEIYEKFMIYVLIVEELFVKMKIS